MHVYPEGHFEKEVARLKKQRAEIAVGVIKYDVEGVRPPPPFERLVLRLLSNIGQTVILIAEHQIFKEK